MAEKGRSVHQTTAAVPVVGEEVTNVGVDDGAAGNA
jgi:hypothetical protein